MSNERPAQAIVGSVDEGWLAEISPWLPEGGPSALTILPDRVVNERGIFSADIAPLVKQMKSQGLDAQFLPTPDQSFKSEYGAGTLIAVSFLLNVASNVAWDSFKFLLRMIALRAKGVRESGGEPRVTLRQGVFRYPDGSSYLWQELAGSPEHVIAQAESAVRTYMSADPEIDFRTGKPNPEAGEPSWTAPE